MHALLLPGNFLRLSLGNVIVHPKIGPPTERLLITTLHQFLIGGVSDALVAAVTAPILALSRRVIIVVPSVGFVTSKRKALVVIDVVGRLVSAGG